jgi:rubredoxin-NAD+ reductase
MKKVVIVGSGLAGYIAATEISNKLPEAELMLITDCDGTYYLKPALSAALAQKKTASDLAMFSAEQMSTRLNMQVVTNTLVTNIDGSNKAIVTNKGDYPYDACILATGSDVIPLNLSSDKGVFTVNSLDDYVKFRDDLDTPKEITIIGSGLVGVEFANDLIASGHKVNLVGDSSYPLPQMIPEKLGLVLKNSMANAGINLYLDETVISINRDAEKIITGCASGKYISSDLVLVAIGIKPNISLAQASGLETNRGVLVDLTCKTNFDDVYALGDCAEVSGMNLFYVPPIRKCAAAIAMTLSGVETKVVYPAMPVTVKSPICPIVACIPRVEKNLDLEISGSGNDLIAKYVDKDKKLCGFALSGEATKLKMELAKDIDNWLE